MQTLNLATPGRVTGAMQAVGRVDPAVEQVFVAAAGNAQARGAQYLIWLVAVIFEQQLASGTAAFARRTGALARECRRWRWG